MPGILDIVASGSSGDSGLSGFFNSPIAAILMPRTAARFQDMQRQNILLAQAQRKQDFAMKFAQSIKDTDPLSAAAILADPSTVDNVLTMYGQRRQWDYQHGIEQQDALAKETRAAEEARKLEEFKTGLVPEATLSHRKAMDKLVSDAVQPSGVMTNPKVQGPRPADELQQGQTADQMTTDLFTRAMRESTGIPDLSQSDAVQAFQDPKSLNDIKQRYSASTLQKDKAALDMEAKKAEWAHADELLTKANASAAQINSAFFGGTPTAPASIDAQVGRWRDTFHDPDITPTEASQLTAAFNGALVTDGGKQPSLATAIDKAQDVYKALRPKPVVTKTIEDPGSKYAGASAEAFAKNTEPEIIKAGNDAAEAMGNVQVLKTALKTAPQGWTPDAAIATIIPGWSVSGDTVQTFVQRIAPSMHQPGSGSQSDIEFAGVLRSLPKLLATKDGNQIVITMMESQMQRRIDRASIVKQMKIGKENGGLSYYEGMKALDDLDRQSIITPEVQKALDKAGMGDVNFAKEGQLYDAEKSANPDIPTMTKSAIDAGITQEEWNAGDPETWKAFP